MDIDDPELIGELKDLDDFMHYIRNRCEHYRESGCDAFTYCTGIHQAREKGRLIFDKSFILKDYETRFFNNLEKAKSLCSKDCDGSIYHFRSAKNYLANIIKLLT